MQEASVRLTFNGVLYLTLGFKQHYLLQVLSVQSHQKDLQLVLYDGLVYIGALYRPHLYPFQGKEEHSRERAGTGKAGEAVRVFDVVRIYPMSVCPNEPMYASHHVENCRVWR
jgi:hypothetical protein